jgi:hypothetical protein
MSVWFLSPANAAADVAVVSPIRHALGEGITDLSHLGKLELRGQLDAVDAVAGEELLRLAPRRGLLVTEGSPLAALERLRGAGVRAYDVSAALAAFEFEGDDALRRLTELDPATFPTAGLIARGTRAVLDARGGGRYRVFVAQELAHSVAEVVLDTMRGLGR